MATVQTLEELVRWRLGNAGLLEVFSGAIAEIADFISPEAVLDADLFFRELDQFAGGDDGKEDRAALPTRHEDRGNAVPALRAAGGCEADQGGQGISPLPGGPARAAEGGLRLSRLHGQGGFRQTDRRLGGKQWK